MDKTENNKIDTFTEEEIKSSEDYSSEDLKNEYKSLDTPIAKNMYNNGKVYYTSIVYHDGLNRSKKLKASNKYELNTSINYLKNQWDEQWYKICEREEKRKNIEDSYSYAKELSKEAEDIQIKLDNILLNTIKPKKLIPEDLKDFSEYNVPPPELPDLTNDAFNIPKRTDKKYNPKLSIFDNLIKRRREAIILYNDSRFNEDLQSYYKLKEEIQKENNKKLDEYNNELNKWENNKLNFEQNRIKNNEEIDKFFYRYSIGEIEAVEKYFTLLLENIELPFFYERNVDISYNKEDKQIIIDITLPIIDDIPKLKSVSYIKIRDEYKKIYYADTYIKNKYESVIYQLILQTINYIFFISSDKLIDLIVLNGKVKSFDKSNGKYIEPYIVSISINRTEFKEINLKNVDPKVWFKKSKGVSATSLSNITPIAPIINISREDKRFIDGYSITANLDNNMNIATMDWQDFENLVREIFEKEFTSSGGEVKITRASRDGGVDAVAFDPDPIRGGKIVIQAKRYTNVVGVSAVRDLYGTVVNEGANKGILVTTSNFGNDAYNFAKGKPITLMNGANLLYLLERHGYNAKIEINKTK